ncbi:MAG: GHKL domain-containing protein, partial [Bacteroidales bacterium]|nr:GHKL domain-containing protein [Bacteroidales bacterium]
HIPSYILLTFFVFLFLIWIFKKIKKTKIFSITRALVFILFFSILSTYILFIVSDEKVKKNMEDMALNITNVRDGGLESYFFHIEENILSDKELLNMLEIIDYTDNSFEARFSETILQKYFSNYKNKYNFQITVCDDYRNLEIQPGNTVINCNEYFNDIVTNYGEKTISKNLIFLDYGYYNTDYLGCLHYNIADKKSQVSVFIEASLKNIPSGLGYPELLVNKSSDNYVDFSEYSYAIYKNNELLKSVGKYLYYLSFTEYNTNKEKFTFFKLNKYMHLLYEPEENVKIIISKKNRSFLHIAAPFSYNLIFFSLFYLILFLIIHPSLDFFKIKISFRNRLQFWIITIIISSFLIVCTSTILYVKKFNFNKNVDVLSEKTHSILIEVQHKMHDVEALSPEQRDYVYSLLLKFSNVFFSDINIYNLNGELFSSSRPEIFKNGFVSKQMNIIAFNELKKKKKNLFIHKEKIGNYEFLSAYMPFRNDQNKLVAYLNLPYFVKQDDYKKEISAFIVTYVSIYLILIVFAIYITLIISGYITRPLQNLKQKIGQLKLDKHNEKIKWKRQDEIGELINEYNRMIDELSKSAELLAKSEREFAWREMARQVAHEIKNPLTPMKLSVQYLNKAWDDRVDNWEEKFKSFSKTIVEQIDSLSDIASSFSDFAKMPKTKNKKIELSSVINSAIDLYKDCSNIEFSFDYIKGKKYYIFADKKQMLRAFNNLIKNSIQAIGKEKHGKIDFVLNENKDRYLIKIIDNGLGIPKDKLNKIFIPNFTTKSGGMGLGLAMVKNIIVSAKGDIWFESEENKGTTFYISLPVLNV